MTGLSRSTCTYEICCRITLYAISDACNYNTGYTITTNDTGVGNASITLPQNGQTYWVFDGLAGGGSCYGFFGLNYWELLPMILPLPTSADDRKELP